MNVLKLYASLLREIRLALPKGSFKIDPAYQYVVSQFHTNQITSEKVCKSKVAAFHQASAYECYLKSSRLHKELLETYYGKGERSIQESANLVGLKLPKTFTDSTTSP